MRGNQIYLCTIERADPDKDFYVVSIMDFETADPIFCFLRKDHAIRDYRPGERVIATFTGKFAGKYPILSQKIPAHIINVLNLFVPEEIKERYDIFFDRAATTRRAKFCKVMVWGKAGLMRYEELNRILSPYISDFVSAMPHPYFIPGGREKPLSPGEDPDARMYINALFPAPVEKIVDHYYEPQFRRVVISLRNFDIPAFLWKDYQNAKTAAKLLKITYRFINIDTYSVIDIDPYNLGTGRKDEEEIFKII